MDFDKFTFRQMSFDCGDADLNDFLFYDAINYYKSMMALTYLLEDNEKCGFMFLSEKERHSSTWAMYFDLINFPE